jgi:hypothetical protein
MLGDHRLGEGTGEVDGGGHEKTVDRDYHSQSIRQ